MTWPFPASHLSSLPSAFPDLSFASPELTHHTTRTLLHSAAATPPPHPPPLHRIKNEQTFCRNPYNVSGHCNRSSCPLANSRYATIREEEGKCFLYVKTIERAHSPLNLWEKTQLPRNYTKALGLLDTELTNWPKYLIHKNKQRLTKM